MSLESIEVTNSFELRQIISAFNETSSRIVMNEQFKELDWRNRAICRGSSSYPFFPEIDNERPPSRIKREEIAKEICARCPVINSCIEYANKNEVQGIWGGLNEEERFLKYGTNAYAYSNKRLKKKT